MKWTSAGCSYGDGGLTIPPPSPPIEEEAGSSLQVTGLMRGGLASPPHPSPPRPFGWQPGADEDGLPLLPILTVFLFLEGEQRPCLTWKRWRKSTRSEYLEQPVWGAGPLPTLPLTPGPGACWWGGGEQLCPFWGSDLCLCASGLRILGWPQAGRLLEIKRFSSQAQLRSHLATTPGGRAWKLSPENGARDVQ